MIFIFYINHNKLLHYHFFNNCKDHKLNDMVVISNLHFVLNVIKKLHLILKIKETIIL